MSESGDTRSGHTEVPSRWVSPYAWQGHVPSALRFGHFPACGFLLLLRPDRPCSDPDLLAALNVVPNGRLCADSPRVESHVLSIADVGDWIHIADDYGVWNNRSMRRAAVESLARLGELFTFLLPDPDMSYAFALYRGRARVRLFVVDSPGFNDQVLRIDRGPPLPGETSDWRGEPFPKLASIARGLGIETEATIAERPYSWGEPWTARIQR